MSLLISVLGDVFDDRGELISRNLFGSFVFGEYRGDHHSVWAVVVADLGKPAEELVPVDVAVADLEVLMRTRRAARRVGDVAKPARAVVVRCWAS
jgi:hypothetical protein